MEFIRTVLLHSSQLDDGERSDFGLVCWLSQLAGPGFVSMSLDSISMCAEELLLCVYVFIFFHREGFFRLQDVQDILEGTDQRSCVVNISWLRYAKFHHLRI